MYISELLWMPFVKSIFRLIAKCLIKDLPSKNTYLLTIGLHILYLSSDTTHSLLFHRIGLRDPLESNCLNVIFRRKKHRKNLSSCDKVSRIQNLSNNPKLCYCSIFQSWTNPFKWEICLY